MSKTLSLQNVAQEMAEAIQEWNRAKRERESWKPVVGQVPPASILGNAKKANAMLSKALEDYEAFQHSVHPTNGGLTLRACVSDHCGWVGKESACLTWKHAGDERMCPHCHDNTESIPLSAISG